MVRAVGARAMAMMIARLDGGPLAAADEVMPTALVIRASTAPPGDP